MKKVFYIVNLLLWVYDIFLNKFMIFHISFEFIYIMDSKN